MKRFECGNGSQEPAIGLEKDLAIANEGTAWIKLAQ
jgi:hypothetical protein